MLSLLLSVRIINSFYVVAVDLPPTFSEAVAFKPPFTVKLSEVFNIIIHLTIKYNMLYSHINPFASKLISYVHK